MRKYNSIQCYLISLTGLDNLLGVCLKYNNSLKVIFPICPIFYLFVIAFLSSIPFIDFVWADDCTQYVDADGISRTIDCLGTQYVAVPLAIGFGIIIGGLAGVGVAAPYLQRYGESFRGFIGSL